MLKLKKEFITVCKECLNGTPEDENLDFPHSLPICILDAVYSIGIRYKSARTNWIKYCDLYNIKYDVMRNHENDEPDKTEHTIADFLNNFRKINDYDKFLEKTGMTRHRTSPKNGILKIEACVKVAEIMNQHGINTVADFRSYKNKETLDSDILSVKGQGSGIMLKYLYMLAGYSDRCKPDRMMLRFVRRYYPDAKESDIQELLESAVDKLKESYPDMTVRWLDNAIWTYEKKLESQKKNRKKKKE
ncbi:MAG: hypothetical protein IKN17_10385 [Ruminococcus sp.]|nr:hypothetical protein [Ruminococcus sp.]